MVLPTTGLLHHNLADSHQFGKESLKIFEFQHIGTIRLGHSRIWMRFKENAIDADGDAGFGNSLYQVGTATGDT